MHDNGEFNKVQCRVFLFGTSDRRLIVRVKFENFKFTIQNYSLWCQLLYQFWEELFEKLNDPLVEQQRGFLKVLVKKLDASNNG